MASESSSEFDVIVCGAGPSGSSCASFLGDMGYSVLLLDAAKFPRDKTCGDAISGKSIQVLKLLGLLDKVAQADSSVINAIVFSSPDGSLARIELPVDQEGRRIGYVCPRQIFDNLVFQNAKSKKSVTTIENASVYDVVKDESGKVAGVKVKSAGKDSEFRAKVVVGADGANSVVAHKVGAWTSDDRHWCVGVRQYYEGVADVKDAIELHFVNSAVPGYFWIFPAGDGKANVGLGMLTSSVKKNNVNMNQLLADIIAKEPLFTRRFKDAKPVSPVKGWNLPYASQHRKCYGNGFVLVGDAASLIDPFTGEGIGNALTSGSIAAQCIDEAFKINDFSEAALKRYSDRLWYELGPEAESSYRLQRMVNYKWLLNFVIRKAATKPDVREAIAGTFINLNSRKTYWSPLFYAKLLLP